jgi:DNA-directed RNA polymerase subunit alpha
VLKAEQIYTIGHLLEHTENDLMRFINMGKKSIKEVKGTLASHGLQLKVKATK